MNLVFDKLAFVRKLEGAEFPRAQAEALCDAVHDAVVGTVATKDDLQSLEQRLDARFERLEARFDSFEQRSGANLKQAASSLKLWTVSVGTVSIVVLFGIFLGLLKLK